MPEDACGSPLRYSAACDVARRGPSGDAPNVIGLTPGDDKYRRAHGDADARNGRIGSMPSGDVIPTGDPRGDVLIPPTRAAAEPPAKTAAVTLAATNVSTCAGMPFSCFLHPRWKLEPFKTIERRRCGPMPPFRPSTVALQPEDHCPDLLQIDRSGSIGGCLFVRHVTVALAAALSPEAAVISSRAFALSLRNAAVNDSFHWCQSFVDPIRSPKLLSFAESVFAC